MKLKDCYSALSVYANARTEDIKKDSRRLALQHHSDVNPGNIKGAEAKFKEINESYEISGNEEMRSVMTVQARSQAIHQRQYPRITSIGLRSQLSYWKFFEGLPAWALS